MTFTTIAIYVADKLFSQLIKEEGYGRGKKWFVSKGTYKKQIQKIIEDTIAEYQIKKDESKLNEKFPFYHSQIIFNLLSEYILFKTTTSPLIIEEFKKNENIIIPSKEELEEFYKIFLIRLKNDKLLKKLYFEENYKETIFEINNLINRVENKIDRIDIKIDSINDKLARFENESIDIIKIRKDKDDLIIKLESINIEIKKTEEDLETEPNNKSTISLLEYIKKEWRELKEKIHHIENKEKEVIDIIKKQFEFIKNIDESTASDRLKRVKQLFLEGKEKEAISTLKTPSREQEFIDFIRSKESVERIAKNYAEEEIIIAFDILRDIDNANRIQEAIVHFETSLRCQRNFLNLFEIAKFYNNIAQFDKAFIYYNELYNLYRIEKKEEDLTFAATLNGIGLLLFEKGDLNNALNYLYKALLLNVKLSGDESIETATSYSNIGLVWKEKGDVKKAIESIQKALVIDLKILPEIHLNISRDYNNLGMIEWKGGGTIENAIEYLEKSTLIILELIGEESMEYAGACNNLGALWQQKGDLDKAFQYFEYSINITQKLLGNENLFVAATLNNIGTIYWAQGNKEQAILSLERAYEISLKLYGANNPTTRKAFHNLHLYKNKNC